MFPFKINPVSESIPRKQLHVVTVTLTETRESLWRQHVVTDDTVVKCYDITVASQWASWRLKSLVSRLFAQAFVQAHVKENAKAPRHWPLHGEFTGDRWGIHRCPMDSPHKGPVTREMFPFDNVIMKSSDQCFGKVTWNPMPRLFHMVF